MDWFIGILLVLLSLYIIGVLTAWSDSGRFDWTLPVDLFATLLVQENIRPKQRDKIFYEAAPPLLLAAAVLAFSFLPLSEKMVLAPLATGGLFINGALAYVMVALLMAGWAPNGAYALVGGWRFLGQLVAYSMPLVMAITAAVMRAESMAILPIIQSQAGLWNIVYQPVGFVLFYLAAMALGFLPPFDLPQAEGELADGVFAEYTGTRRALIGLARSLLIFTLSLAVTVFYLGGWLGPCLPDLFWTFAKTLVVTVSFFVVGRYLPRLRHDHILEWSWKFGTPAALLNIFWVGVLLLIE